MKVLIIEVLSKIVADDILLFFFYYYFSEKIRFGGFMWIMCYADNLHEMPGFNSSE